MEAFIENNYLGKVYGGLLLVHGMYPTLFFPGNTLKINGFATNQENPRTSSPLYVYVVIIYL